MGAGLTQGALAARLGVSRHTVQSWELGRNPCAPWHWERLKRVVNCKSGVINRNSAD